MGSPNRGPMCIEAKAAARQWAGRGQWRLVSHHGQQFVFRDHLVVLIGRGNM
eukprot:CAMPEP_0184438174 /NCGR_PEP_ID=MMETSP0738-20130409/637326_1 /TAXON_ID=385413 /ORGANISM="Thalassiosira miniscula, Strain CCMP1093" /LENGTH=51 /DNA_ID=CAMNT_0026805421 /DNA_START=98 /DNA_END=250 /DNA_ORIENTATION=+